MHTYFTIISLIAGICLGFGILYLFVSLRRKTDKRLSFTFSLFAICYAITLINGIRWYSSTSVVEHIAILRFDAIFVALAYIALIWYIAFYSGFKPRIFLWVLTTSLILPAFIHILSPAAFSGEVLGITQIILPQGENLNNLEAAGSFWYDLVLLARFVSLGYIILALISQYRHGERRSAIILGLGLLPFVVGISYEILGESGFVPYIPLGEIGFLGIAIAASIQMASLVIQTEEELELHRNHLEKLVDDRTQELEVTASALRQSERQARALLNAPPDSALLLGTKGTILDINTIAAERLGVNIDEARGANINILFAPDLYEFRMIKIQEVITHKKSERWEDVRNGRTFDNNLYPILDDNGNVNSIAVFGADITELKLLQLREKESAAEEERKRIARDLHDAVTQTIYSASLIAEVLPQVWERNPDEGRRNLTKLRALVRGALAEMRTLLFELRPAALEAANFEILLGQLGDALHGRTRIPVHVECDDKPDLIPAVKVTLYRIAQEAINNIIKHAGATETQLALKQQSGQILLRVWDNGRGFDPTKTPNGGLGLVIMRERTESIGAEFDVESRPGQGTQVSVRRMEPNQEENEG